jgi:hypothetical protein
MEANAFPLKYQCKTSGNLISARKLADRRYSILKNEGSKAETISQYSLRKDFKFISDSAPKNTFKVKPGRAS